MIVVHGLATGRGHINNSIECQDNLDIRVSENSFVFAVADGAGSAVLSRVGSELAVRTFCDSLSESILLNPANTCLIGAFEDARKAIEEEAIKRHCNIKDLHTTLFGGVYLEAVLRCAGIGDTIGFVLSKDDETLIPIQPAKGDFINETIFITSEHWKECLNVSDVIENPKALIACSDGLLNIVYSLILEDGLWKVVPHKDVIENIISYVSQNSVQSDINYEISNMLQGDKANSLNEDDKALIVAILDRPINGKE
jgi:serine/threonine protein phosphatase PrpC